MSNSIGTLPVTLQNGTVNDATQVMLDLNWIVNQVNANVFAKIDLTAVAGAGNIGFSAGQSYSTGTIGYAMNNIFGVPYYSTGGDDAVGWAALCNANASRVVNNAAGGTLNFFTTATITADGVIQEGNGGTISQNTANIDSILVQPTTAGTANTYHNFGKIRNFTISHSIPATAGATSGYALNLTQCNSFQVEDMNFIDGDVQVAGGQLSGMTNCYHYASSGGYKGTGSALVHFTDAPYTGGNYQRCFTFTVDNWKASATKLRDALFRIHSGDGVQIGYGYGSNALTSLILVLADHAGSYVAGSGVSDAYLDCGNNTTGTVNGIELRADAFSTSPIYSFFSVNNQIGNGRGSGVLVRKTETYALTIDGGQILNNASWAIDAQAGTTMDIIIDGVQIQNNGSSGDVRLAGGRSITYTGNIHFGSQVVCLTISGTWRSGSATGNNNVGTTGGTGTANDISISGATFTVPFVFSGNQSSYNAASPTNSWRGLKANFPAYSTLSAAQTALGTGTGYVVSIANVLNVT